ncbi:MAG: signal peptide peptidase SppA [Desulfobacterales bacterium]|uniref:Signal peptide peptidase SppA n=1 Tax=Candidatus Desulfatibia profunda TaxID=2841695 RepID=A0A8J6NQQ2_9BACT|nr:signal peptide peptidase SppA [Candidatus Desulfatibia profunda]MBL7179050.1 signal peptide peptidase SppA [Desulfobacterales bacterium]
MFSRRHPYLFFILIFTSVIAVAMIGMSLLFVLGARTSDFEFGEKVGIIEINGIIADAQKAIHNLKRFREDDSIKAIVVRIDSPGGAVGPSQEIFREIRKTSNKKKVIASMGAIAASGGYYVAAGTDGIVANPGTITGSIGVIMGFTNYQELLQKIGLVPIVVKSGEFKDMGSPVRSMTAEEHKILKSFAEKIHRQFIMDIVEGRKLDRAKVESLADGRIFTGEESKDLGLVDRLGNLEDAIEWAGRLGGIKGKISAVYAREKKFSLLKYLSDSSVKGLFNQIFRPYLTADYLYRPE